MRRLDYPSYTGYPHPWNFQEIDGIKFVACCSDCEVNDYNDGGFIVAIDSSAAMSGELMKLFEQVGFTRATWMDEQDFHAFCKDYPSDLPTSAAEHRLRMLVSAIKIIFKEKSDVCVH